MGILNDLYNQTKLLDSSTKEEKGEDKSKEKPVDNTGKEKIVEE